MVFYDATQVEFYKRPLAAILTNIKTSVDLPLLQRQS